MKKLTKRQKMAIELRNDISAGFKAYQALVVGMGTKEREELVAETTVLVGVITGDDKTDAVGVVGEGGFTIRVMEMIADKMVKDQNGCICGKCHK